MKDKLLLGLKYLDMKFKKPEDLETLLPHIEKVLSLAMERESFSSEEEFLLKKLLYKIDRFAKFNKEFLQNFQEKFSIKGSA